MGTEITRLPHWETALHETVQRHLGSPLEYGRFDCTLFALMCIDAMCGCDLYDQALGRWTDLESAVRYRKAYDPPTLETHLLSIGCAPVQPNYQQPGDIIIQRDERFDLVYICLGVMAAYVDEDNGCGLAKICDIKLFDAILRIP